MKRVRIPGAAGLALLGLLLFAAAFSDGGYVVFAQENQADTEHRRPIEHRSGMAVRLSGDLISRTTRVGTKQEGPEYYLLLGDGREIHVLKTTSPTKPDRKLQEKVGHRVRITGVLVENVLVYNEIYFYDR